MKLYGIFKFMTTEQSLIVNHRKAFFNYEIQEKMEAGIVLVGTEVKSIRSGHIQLRDAYAKIMGNELWLIGAYIAPYKEGNRYNVDPERNRKLLVHKHQMAKWAQAITLKGWVAVPISVYFNKNKVKVELGLGKPKKLHDKRQSIKDKDIKRDVDRVMSRY